MFIVLEGKKLCCAAGAVLLACTLFTVYYFCPASEPVQTSASVQLLSRVWVIDAGHGGEDGGAVAADGTRESEINLAVAKRVEALLCFLGEQTRMTRTEDVSIHSPEALSLRQKKRSDLENRVAIVNETQDAVLVSIHQNSLPSSRQTHGAQVFFGKVALGEDLAESIQNALNISCNAGNEKSKKEIDASIFLLKSVTAPAVLIECGFLSNAEETHLLKTEAYQQKLAVTITAGLMNAA